MIWRARFSPFFHMRDRPYTVTHSGVTLEMRTITAADASEELKEHEVLCTATMEKVPNRAVREWLENRPDEVPHKVQEFANRTWEELSVVAMRALDLGEWVMGDLKQVTPTFSAFDWSIDGATWTPAQIPSRMIACINTTIGSCPTSDFEAEFGGDQEVPIAWTMLMEAWHIHIRNPKSGVIMAVAAAETGVKHLIAQLVPDAAWLMERVQSPPIVTMLRDYLPTLPTRLVFNGMVLPPPPSIIADLEKGVGLRNRIVHGRVGKLQPHHDTACALLKNTRDLLHLLDYYAGHSWGDRRLRDHVRVELAGMTLSSPEG